MAVVHSEMDPQSLREDAGRGFHSGLQLTAHRWGCVISPGRLDSGRLGAPPRGLAIALGNLRTSGQRNLYHILLLPKRDSTGPGLSSAKSVSLHTDVFTD
jgi:hypothetical protein